MMCSHLTASVECLISPSFLEHQRHVSALIAAQTLLNVIIQCLR